MSTAFKRLTCTEESMKMAMDAVKDGMSKNKSLSIFKVPRSTLITNLQR